MAAKDTKETKDSKHVAPSVSLKGSGTGSVLSKVVSGAASAPKSRLGAAKKRVVIEDYVSIDGEDPDGSVSPDDLSPRSASLAARGLAPSQANPVDRSLALTDAELEQFLLREIASRGGSRHEGSLAESKHLYGAAGALFTVGGTEVASASTAIALGTTVSTRLTNTVCLRRLRLKFLLTRVFVASGNTLGAVQPEVHFVVFRDKTPAIPGTAPTVHGTDAAPPASISLIFSRLGGNQGPDTDRTMILNPITEDLYHIYTYKRFKWSNEGTQQMGTLGTQEWAFPTMYQVHEENIDLNEVRQIYAGSAATPITNAVYCVFWSDVVDDNGLGFTQGWRLVSDCEFHDVQDD